MGVKLEIGGGIYPRGEGFLNLDLKPNADIRFDLNSIPPGRLPFDDDTVEECYSSHCFEHIKEPLDVMKEVARVMTVGSHFEMRVPHWLSDIAMCYDHRQVMGPMLFRNWLQHFKDEHWPKDKNPKILRLDNEEYSRSAYFDELRELYLLWREDQVLRFAPGACHDIRYHFTVVPNA